MLVARNLRAHLAGREIFSGLHFELPPGQLLAVVGPSGCGKTTLLRAVAGLAPSAQGEVALSGQSREQWGPRAWRSRVALVPQEPPPILGSLSDFAGQVAKLDVRRKRNGPGELLGELSRVARELGLDEKHRDQPFEELSGGERARLYLSLVLATQPDVLLLDEPTSALDQSSKELVERQLQGRTALIVTHEAAQVDRLSAETLVMGS